MEEKEEEEEVVVVVVPVVTPQLFITLLHFVLLQRHGNASSQAHKLTSPAVNASSSALYIAMLSVTKTARSMVAPLVDPNICGRKQTASEAWYRGHPLAGIVGSNPD